MLIRVGCQLLIACEEPTVMLALVHPHGSRHADLVDLESLELQPAGSQPVGLVSGAALTSATPAAIPVEVLCDRAGNRWSRFLAPAGSFQFHYAATIANHGLADPVVPSAMEGPLSSLPIDTYRYLNPSRFCDTDRLLDLAWSEFGSLPPGWTRVQAVCDWVHTRIRFDHDAARASKCASETLAEQAGVCRDFAHLAITLCRCLNIPARYCTGYLGYTGVVPAQDPVDFSAWFEVFLGGRWYVFDARYNTPRIGRVLIARGRDAAEVPFLRSFGPHQLLDFQVITQA
ncbi:MAG: transglutaminase family protein [Prochlorococcaceae cyanobacterium]